MKKILAGLLTLLLLVGQAQAAGTKISELPTCATAVGTDTVPVVQSGVTCKQPITGLSTYFLGQTTGVTFPLAVNKGGIGAATLTQYGVLLGNGTSALSTVSGLGTSGQVLTSAGAGAPPAWQTISALPSQTGNSGKYLTTDGTNASWATVAGGGSGDVVGPASATDNAVVRFDLTTGKLIQNSAVAIDDSANVSGVNSLSSGSIAVSSSIANALAVGQAGTTNPVLQVDASATTAATGLQVLGAAAGSGLNLNIISSGTNENGVFTCSKGTGTCTIGTNSTGTMNIKANGTTRYSLSSSGAIHTFSSNLNSAAVGGHFVFTGAADTAMTAGTDTAVMTLNFAQTKQHASNTTVANNYGVNLLAPTYSFASVGGTVTKASTLRIDGPPVAGTNATITTPYGFELSTGNAYIDGKIVHAATNTAGGTTGAQTINKPSGTVNFAAGSSSLVVTNSLVTTSSLVFAVVRTADSTATIKNVVPASGSFTINLGANATAETSVGFLVVN